MAIMWEFTITPIDIPNRIVSVSATRTDDSPTDPDPTYTVSMQNADISTTAKKTEALNALWAKYEKQVAEQATLNIINAEIDTLQIAAKANFEGREP
ncbi:hypothetical protein LCGC14_0939540 [marine sediment metagenome]|uniref:Uncharacterized protein n=1 Tax=marine sediment metagenome TaxID=412755 RepID=A0A0F9NKI3_9ZZZZ